MNNKSKTILFATLIVAMILPFSSMNAAEAQTDTRTIDEITSEAIRLDKELQNNKKLTSEEREIIEARLVELGDEFKKVADIKSQSKIKKRSTGSNFKIEAKNYGCDKNTDKMYAKGTIYKDSVSFWLSYNFPPSLSHGIWPKCHEDTWNDNLNIIVVDVLNSNRGCVANWTTSAAASHQANCQIGQGLWRIQLTGEYQHQNLGGSTYVVII